MTKWAKIFQKNNWLLKMKRSKTKKKSERKSHPDKKKKKNVWVE